MASMAALAVLAARSEGRSECTGPDPLRDQADACLEGLEVTARLEAMLAARKVRFTAGFANVTRAMSPPEEQPHQRLAREMGVVAEVACALTVSERTASALLAESHQLTTTLPLTQTALEQGLMSFQHARVMVDEAGSLDPAGAAARQLAALMDGLQVQWLLDNDSVDMPAEVVAFLEAITTEKF